MDPAKANTQAAWSLLDLTYARLMAYSHKPPPAAFVPVPEVAARPPTISRDGRTYTFRLRRGFRFNDRTPVDARAFATAINRTLAPDVRSLGAKYMEDIVGARDVRSGRARTARGVVGRGYRLTIHSRVELSMSVKRKVTAPLGRSAIVLDRA
jgi:ABC-type oligopeptide transport system substrate-binding subunit